jgi:PRTRC genetic system ThiF family protein
MKHPLPSSFADNEICIAVAGAGGNGTQMITGLARMDLALKALGHPGLNVNVFDPDIVTEANVGRQLFSPSDIGQYKAEVLVHRLNCYFGLDWAAYHTRYKAGQRFSDGRADVLIGCVDSAAARRDLAQTKFRYWLDLGNTEKKGQVILGQTVAMYRRTEHLYHPDKYANEDEDEAGVLADDEEPAAMPRLRGRRAVRRKVAAPQAPPARLPTVLDIFPELKRKNAREDTAPSCSLAEALGRQDLFINQTVATFALQLLWQFIRQGGLDIHGYFINLESGKVTPLPIK